ncbi:MAG TPA: hypothetical protein VFJ58_19520 [Armatimonadota bacterium]|nr:hypothetical protein [Armatimonadota bacterium]
MMYHGANGYGIAAFLSALVALVGTHLYATDSGRRERIEKSRILAGQPQIEETPEIERGGAAS